MAAQVCDNGCQFVIIERLHQFKGLGIAFEILIQLPPPRRAALEG